MEEKKMEEKRVLTDPQKFFIVGKRELAKFERIKQERPLTKPEHDREDYVKEALLRSIWKYGIQLSRQMMSKYMLPTDAYSDVQQAIAAIFYEKLPNYDPFQSTPTTYFSRYFKQVIDEYIHKDSQRLSQYDAHNVSKVRAAIHYYESQGIKWDESMLMNRTGLSMKVLRNTMYLERNSKQACIDDMFDLESPFPTPEDACIQDEKSRLVNKVLAEDLTEDELRIIRARFNNDSNRPVPFDTMAKKLNIPVRDVKKKFNSIIAKLHNNPTLFYLYNGDKRIRKVSVNLQPKYPDSLEDDILMSIKNI